MTIITDPTDQDAKKIFQQIPYEDGSKGFPFLGSLAQHAFQDHNRELSGNVCNLLNRCHRDDCMRSRPAHSFEAVMPIAAAFQACSQDDCGQPQSHIVHGKPWGNKVSWQGPGLYGLCSDSTHSFRKPAPEPLTIHIDGKKIGEVISTFEGTPVGVRGMGEVEFTVDFVDHPAHEDTPDIKKMEFIISRVDHPLHYGGDVDHEHVKCAEAWGLFNNAMLYNATKYICRAGKKGDTLEDLRKARWYLDREITRLEKSGDHNQP